MSSPLLHAPLESAVDVSFWVELARMKLEELQLSEASLPLRGFMAPSNGGVSSPLQLTADSLDVATARQSFVVPGLLVVANTVEAFDQVDRAAFLREHGAVPLMADLGGDALTSPARLCRFVLHVFPDLKRFTFKYWFAFPALQLTAPVGLASSAQPLATLDGSDGILAACDSWLRSDSADVAWLVVRGSDGQAEVHTLSSWPSLAHSSAILAFIDPCGLPLHPGWPLRNLLVLARSIGIAGRLQVLSARMLQGRLVADRCLLFSLDMPGAAGERPGAGDTWLKADAVGWERDVHGQLSPRLVDLKSTLDPHERAAQAADLNLKLMAWRMFPECDAAMLHGKRCLLIGAGTLGCAVARTLLGWGVRDITFVDNGLVSFSNPVRQSLFEYEDCLDGGRPKAAAAAERLVRIFPKVAAKAVCLTVHRPGHSVLPDDEASVLSDIARLDALVANADCVFVLTDTRESRWLPTLLCAHHNKLLINTGLGFESFVVMRHGCRSSQERLGCYFCTDVTAPIDSTRHRSLDQQCTVTRPGLAFVAAALAVELAVSVWHHAEGQNAPAGSISPLGEVPHQIRGALSRFEQRCFAGAAFHQCVACSNAVVDAYRGSQRDAFLLSVLNDGSVLERLTGLAALHFETSVEACAWDEDEADPPAG